MKRARFQVIELLVALMLAALVLGLSMQGLRSSQIQAQKLTRQQQAIQLLENVVGSLEALPRPRRADVDEILAHEFAQSEIPRAESLAVGTELSDGLLRLYVAEGARTLAQVQIQTEAAE